MFSRGATALISERATSAASASSRTTPMPYQVLTNERTMMTSRMPATATATSTSIRTKPRLLFDLATAGGHDVDETGEPIDADAPVKFALGDMDDGSARAAVRRKADGEAARLVGAELAGDDVEPHVGRKRHGDAVEAAGNDAVGDVHAGRDLAPLARGGHAVVFHQRGNLRRI